MSLQEIFQNVQSWLAGLWSYPIPWGTLFLWAAIIVGAMGAIIAVAVFTTVFNDGKDNSDAPGP
jgi:hypothetical protein